MLRQVGTAKLRQIQDALTGENAANLNAMLEVGARNWFADVDAISKEMLDEAVMGKAGGKPTKDFKKRVQQNMDRTATSGFAALHDILGYLLGERKQLPDDYEGELPDHFEMIIEDQAKDTRRKFGANLLQ